MKRRNKFGNKWAFIVVAVLIVVFAFSSFFGFDDYYGDFRQLYVKGAGDIRWGIDISGGVEAIFSPDKDVDSITDDDMDSAKQIIETRMVYNNITDYEVFTDYENRQIIVRFPWQSDDENYDPTAAIDELGETALLTFYKGETNTGEAVLQGSGDIAGAEFGGYSDETGYCVSLNLTDQGTKKFAIATSQQLNNYISIYMDDVMISCPKVQSVINDGNAQITGLESAEAARELAQKINAGSLPFALTVDDSKLQVISPSLGAEALNVMLIAGIVAFALICLMMIFRYRLPGVIACIGLVGQAAGMIAFITGFFPGTSSFTMTLPGIAGIILAIGFGVDANVITSERIKEELRKGKTIDGAVSQGYSSAFSSILDGNITNVLVAVVLLAAFGNPDSLLARVFGFIFPFLSSSVTGTIYSFGYTLITGVICNFIMGVFASRVMLMGVSRFKFLRKPWLYGAPKDFGAYKAKEEKKRKIDYVAFIKKSAIISGAVLLVGVISTVFTGVGFDINFAGGSRMTYSYTGDVNIDSVKQVITDGIGVEPQISLSTDYSSDAKKLVISFAGDVTDKVNMEKVEALLQAAAEKEKAEAEQEAADKENNSSNVTSSETASSSTTTSSTTSSSTVSGTTSSEEEEVVSETMVAIQSAVGHLLNENFKDNGFKSQEVNTVNPTLATAFFVKSLFAVLLAAVLVIVYIGIRFHKIGGVSAGVASFVALLHDVIISFLVCAVLGFDIDANFFAVVLTLFGYSLNATIVVFDRVRENRKMYPSLSVREQVNKSIGETLARSIMTSLTTFVALICIVIVAEFFGVTALRSFAIPMAVGVIAGCFSSIFIAGPLWVKWNEFKNKKPSV